MGRRPNALILDYFDRGAKLNDSSNRYQHSCKRCGERFPKGRNDVLTSHLTKKCPSLSLAERTAIVLQVHDLTDPEEAETALRNGTNLVRTKAGSAQSATSRTGFNGLNVLAEATRRVAAKDRPRTQAYNDTDQISDQDSAVLSTLDINGYPQLFPDSSLSNNNGIDAAGSSSVPLKEGLLTRIDIPFVNTPTNLPPFSYLQSGLTSNTLGDMQTPGPMLPDEASDTPGLTTTMDQLQNENVDTGMSQETISAAMAAFARINDSLDRDVLRLEQPPQQISWQNGVSVAQDSQILPQPTLTSQTNTNTVPQFVTESGTCTKSSKPKVRGRFTSERRKEVKSIRDQGACLRCRMLKKSCSKSNPCDACSAVANPRLWKQACVRSKLTHSFKPFFIGLNSLLSHYDVSNFKRNRLLHTYEGRIEAFHFEGQSTLIPLQALYCRPDSLISPSNDKHIYLIDTEHEDLQPKIQQYLSETYKDFWDTEPFQVVKTTLETALNILVETQDVLLQKTIELWVSVQTLVDSNVPWALMANTKKQARDGVVDQSEPVSLDALKEGQKLITQTNSSHSFALINSQLRAATEKFASGLAKVVINELEHRLLQKHQDKPFATFLVAILLLNCVERVTWTVKIWENRDDWPLENVKPQEYAKQGERFTQILHMMLEMRNIVPRTTAASQNDTLVPQDTNEEVVKWFEQASLTPAFLKQRSEAEFNKDDVRSMDGCFLARIMLSKMAQHQESHM